MADSFKEDESLEEFLNKLGAQPNMQSDWAGAVSVPEQVQNISSLPIDPYEEVEKTIEVVSENLAVDVFPVGEEIKVGTPTTDEQQKRNIGVISYSLGVQNIAITAEEIWKAWPTEGDFYKLQRAGKRPSLTAIQHYMGTETYLKDMAERGIEFAVKPGGLSDEQIALLSILSDTTAKSGLNARLRKAGVTSAKFRAWKRQPAFNNAFKKLVHLEMEDANEAIDVQLVSMAQNGDLNAIKYYKDLVGRGPNDRKAVDAMEFSRVVLEAVMKNVTPDQLKAISAEIELASKAIKGEL